MTNFNQFRTSFAGILLAVVFCAFAPAQSPVNRIKGHLNEQQVVTLTGNVHPAARSEFDQGAVSANLPLGQMVLQLQPSKAQQAALDALVAAQHDPQSPLYQQWLTPEQYGARFGVSASDLAAITAWLASHGFTIDEVTASRRQIIFSGNAGQVADTFHTELHRYLVNGAAHIANAQDPQIPAALAGVVTGVVSLHDFRRNSEIRSRQSLGANPQFSSGSTHYVFPADFATIYDLNPLYNAGTKGAGISIAVVGRSNINLSDVAGFRTISALPANVPNVIITNNNPGLVSGDQAESTLDVEWAGAVAPAATVQFVVSSTSSTTDGVDLSAQYAVNHKTAPVMSTSYGSCEADMNNTETAFYNSLWQQAASEGITALVSSGDSGAAGCYSASTGSASGTGVNGLCSSPYSTCVGGTEFNEGNNTAQYWATSNGTGDSSALSYIPEMVWNESGSNGGQGLWSSGGGVSLLYAQPSYQKGITGTSAGNGMRTVPDVSVTAAANHDGYIIEENGSYWVIGGTSAASPSFAGIMALVLQSQGGTGVGNANTSLYPLTNASKNPFHATQTGSNSVPGVTGFTANGATYNLATGLGSVDGAVLVSSWGNGNTTPKVDFTLTPSATSGTVLTGKSTTFTITAVESGSGKNAVSFTASAPAGITVGFNPSSVAAGQSTTVTVTAGATAAAGTQNITITGTDNTGTQTATYALTVTAQPTLALTAASSTATLQAGATTPVKLTATTGGSYTGNLSFTVSGLPAGVTAQWSSNPLTATVGNNLETLTLAAASTTAATTANVVVTVTGDGLSATQNITLTVNALTATLAMAPAATSVTVAQAATATDIFTLTGNSSFTGAVSLSVTGLPSGVTAGWTANPVTLNNGTAATTLKLSAGSTAAIGSASIVVTATGGGITVTNKLTLQVQPGPSVSLASSPASLTMVSTATSTLTVTATPAGGLVVATGSATKIAPRLPKSFNGGEVNFANAASSVSAIISIASGLPTGITAAWSAPAMTATGAVQWTLTLTGSQTAVGTTGALALAAQITGTNGIVYAVTASVPLTVTAVPTLTLTPAATTMMVVNPVEAITTAQTVASQTLTLAGNSNFKGAVTLSASGLPPYLTAAFSSSNVTMNSSNTGTAKLTITAGAANLNGAINTVAPGTYAVTITATGSGATVTKTIQVQVAGATVTPSATAVTLHRGKTASFSVSVTPQGGVTGIVIAGFTASTNLTGITASASPASIPAPGSGTSTFTLSASSTAALGSVQLYTYAEMYPNTTSNAPLYIGWGTAVVNLSIVQ